MALTAAQAEAQAAEIDAKSKNFLKNSLIDVRTGLSRIADIVTTSKYFAYQKSKETAHEAIDFNSILESALRLTHFELKYIKIKKSIPRSIMILGDKTALISVLVNLLTNSALALKNLNDHNKHIEIKIIINQSSVKNKYLLFSIEDNGAGITPLHMKKIFEPFFTTKNPENGLGLGLAYSHNIIKEHGGTLSVESEINVFTRFSFDLPLAP
jgi:two-component system, sensor histidine kinase PhcS